MSSRYYEIFFFCLIKSGNRLFQFFCYKLAFFVLVVSTVFASAKTELLCPASCPVLIAVVHCKLLSFLNISNRKKCDWWNSEVIMSSHDSNWNQIVVTWMVYESESMRWSSWMTNIFTATRLRTRTGSKSSSRLQSSIFSSYNPLKPWCRFSKQSLRRS